MMGSPVPTGPPDPSESLSASEYLTAAKIVALVIGILELVGFLAAVVFALLGFGFSWFGGFLLVGSIVNLLLFIEIGPIQDFVDARQYVAAQARTRSWMVLGFIFSWLIIGVLLFLAYRRYAGLLQVQAKMAAPTVPFRPDSSRNPTAPLSAGPSGSAVARSGVAPVGSSGAPGTPACPRCGRPTTWIPQYARWFCYPDMIYL